MFFAKIIYNHDFLDFVIFLQDFIKLALFGTSDLRANV